MTRCPAVGSVNKAPNTSVARLRRPVLPTSRGRPREALGEGGKPGGRREPPLQSTWDAGRESRSPGPRHQAPPLCARSRANRDIVLCKIGVCNSMRAKFYSVAQEAGFCLQDKMEILMK